METTEQTRRILVYPVKKGSEHFTFVFLKGDQELFKSDGWKVWKEKNYPEPTQGRTIQLAYKFAKNWWPTISLDDIEVLKEPYRSVKITSSIIDEDGNEIEAVVSKPADTIPVEKDKPVEQVKPAKTIILCRVCNEEIIRKPGPGRNPAYHDHCRPKPVAKPKVIDDPRYYSNPCRTCNEPIPRTGKRGPGPKMCKACKEAS